jgi:hypothetical protein
LVPLALLARLTTARAQDAVRDEVALRLWVTTAMSASLLAEQLATYVTLAEAEAGRPRLVRAVAGGDPARRDPAEIGRELSALLVRLQRRQWRAEAALAVARDQARDASRLRTEFLSRVSHELRTSSPGPGTPSCMSRTTLEPAPGRAVLARRGGVRPLTAGEGEIVQELVREHRPDLVLLGLHLPGIDGEEVLRRLRADPRTADLPVVMISADVTA